MPRPGFSASSSPPAVSAARVRSLARPPSRGELVLAELDCASSRQLEVLAAVAVCAPDGRTVIASQHSSWVSALADARALAWELACLGERNAGVVVISTMFSAARAEGWPSRADSQCLVADVALVVALVRLIELIDGETVFERPRKSNMQRFGELVASGVDATEAGHRATGRVQ